VRLRSETLPQPLLPAKRFVPFAALATLSLLSPLFPSLSLEDMLGRILRFVRLEPAK
jgi:hypothetical protein